MVKKKTRWPKEKNSNSYIIEKRNEEKRKREEKKRRREGKKTMEKKLVGGIIIIWLNSIYSIIISCYIIRVASNVLTCFSSSAIGINASATRPNLFGVGDGGSRTENFFFVIEGGSRTEFLFDPVLDGAAEDAAEFDLSPGFPIGPVICPQSGIIFENFTLTSIIIGSIFVEC